MISYRQSLWAVAALAAAGTAGSFVSQYVLGLNPCPLCILQRVAIILLALVALPASLLANVGRGGRLLAALLASAPAVWGLGVAVYQIWLQSLPPEIQPSCGAPWTFRLRDWPLFDWWEPVVRGFGDCGVREYVLGLPLPVWSALFFSAALVWVWVMFVKARR